MKNTLVVVSSLALLASTLYGSEYYWNVASGTWGSFSDPANWLVDGGPNGTAATTAPGEADSLCRTQNFSFALGGVTNKIGTWNATANWDAYNIAITNGTLMWMTLFQTHGTTLSIYDGATFTLDPAATFNASQDAGASTYVNVYSNGLFDLNGSAFILYHLTLKNYPGGTVRLPYRSINFAGNSQTSDIENDGTLSMPSGMTFVGTSASTVLNIKQNAGILTLGGNITQNRQVGTLNVTLGGGTLKATTTIAIEAASASIPAGKSVTVDVAANASLDMSTFTYGSGASLTKTGAGTLRLGATLPLTLTVSAGDIGLYGANATIDLSSATLAQGTQVTFGAAGITLSAVPAGVTLSYAVDTAAVPQNVVFLTCSDPTLLATIKRDITASLPASVGVEETDGSLKLVPVTSFVFDSTTVTDWNDPAGWACGYVPTNENVFVKGAGVTARITAAIPTNASIQVLDGATLSIETAFDCPPIKLTGPCTLALANGATVTLTNGLTCVATSASTMPILSIPTGATLKVPGGMTFGNIAMQIGGTLATIGSGHLKLGYAKINETAYFGLAATNATITWSSTTYQSGDLMIACPETGGKVVAPSAIRLKACTLPTGTWDNLIGLRIGISNPTGNVINVVMDGTRFRRSSYSTIAGGSILTLTNGASFYTEENDGLRFPLYLRQRGQVIVYKDSSLIQYVVDYGLDMLRVEPDEAGFPSIILRNGTLRIFASSGNNKGTLSVENGTVEIYRAAVYRSDANKYYYCVPFEGFKSVEIARDSVLTMKGVTSNTKVNKFIPLANVPFTGGGSLVVTNAAANYTFSVLVSNAANTAAGTVECATNATLLFNNGANWAGPILANGAIALTNTASATAISTNAFGTVDLSGSFALHVGANGASDWLNLSNGFVNDGGAITLQPLPGYTLTPGDAFPFAEVPDSGDRPPTLPLGSPGNWKATAAADPNRPGWAILTWRSFGGTIYRFE